MILNQAARYLTLTAVAVALVSCGDNGGVQTAAGATSALCPNVLGTEAILWDLYNGVIRTDVDVLPPPIPTGGGSYTNPTFPLLGFIYPGGWTPETTGGGLQNVGVNLIRQDQQAVWREESLTVNGAPAARDIRDFEVQQLLQFLGQQDAEVETVCTNEGTTPAGGGIVLAFSNIMIRVGNHTAVVDASVTPFPGLPNSSVRAKMVTAPTAEFPDLAIDTFLAIDWQMLLGDNRNLFDRDGDGWLDGVDQFPDDPTRH